MTFVTLASGYFKVNKYLNRCINWYEYSSMNKWLYLFFQDSKATMYFSSPLWLYKGNSNKKYKEIIVEHKSCNVITIIN